MDSRGWLRLSGLRGRALGWEGVEDLLDISASEGLEVMLMGVEVGMFVANDERRVAGEGEHFVRHHPKGHDRLR